MWVPRRPDRATKITGHEGAANRLDGSCSRIRGGSRPCIDGRRRGDISVSAFFAKGMLLNVLNAMQLFDSPTPWGDRLIAGCRPED